MALRTGDDETHEPTTADAVPRPGQAEVLGDLSPDSGDPGVTLSRFAPRAVPDGPCGDDAPDEADAGPVVHQSTAGEVVPFPSSSTTVPPCGSTGAAEPGIRDYRDAHGRFAKGNTSALVTGQHSTAFWQGALAAQAEIVAAVLRDLGHADEGSAPAVVVAVVRNLAQAVLLRDSAFAKITEQGGGLTERTNRSRNAVRVWSEAADKVLGASRMLGLERKAAPIRSASDVVRGL